MQADIGEITGEGDVGAYVTFRTEKDQSIQVQSGIEESLGLLREGLSKFPEMYDMYKQYVKTLRRARNFDEIIDNFNEKGFREIPVWFGISFNRA